MKRFIFTLTLFSALTANAQTYWQQHVATKIDVRLDDVEHYLHGREEFVYTNNSPDTLRNICIHLWPNAYKHDHTPYARQQDRNGDTKFYYAKEADRGFIDSLEFSVDGRPVDHNIADNTPDYTILTLPKPLPPGQKIKVTTPFRVKIPKVFSRLGHTGQAYFISQWFPKPAVYDSRGWHPLSYLDQGEFYSEFGSYDVTITVPRNYVVMATGNCTDESEDRWLDSLSRLPLTDSASQKFPPSASETKTLHFFEDNIHDFAWFADKRWLVRKDSVLSPGTEHLVYAYAAFLPGYQKSWKRATEFLCQTVKHYGKWVGPYPYNTIKAVLGDMHAGGGMEYPTVTIIDRTATSALKTVIVHEAGHNWFYGMLGSNEREHPWMDEGLNTFYEKKTTSAMPDTGRVAKLVNSAGGVEEKILYQLAATHRDQTIDQDAVLFAKANYGLDVYFKTYGMLRVLEQYMGQEDFEKGMKSYYNKWHFKHPYPDDFKNCMQAATDKSLDWFFYNYFFANKRIDYGIAKVKNISSNAPEVVVRNNSGLLSPVRIGAYHGDSLLATAWSQPFTGKTSVSITAPAAWDNIRIDSMLTDVKAQNNIYYAHGCHKFSLHVSGFAGINSSSKYKLYLAPALAYNQYDGGMAGLLLHNITVPEHRFRFIAAPLYSFNTGTLNGAASLGYSWFPAGWFQEVLLQGDVKSFHNNEGWNMNDREYYRYIKTAAMLEMTIREHDLRSSVTRRVILKGYNIAEEAGGVSGMQWKQYGVARYLHKNARVYNPFSYAADVQASADFVKLSIEGKIKIDYNTPKKALYIRGYVGKFVGINGDPSKTSRYLLNASYSGLNDYLYDGTYLARNGFGNFASQQLSVQEGGFKVPVYNAVARSDNYLATVNLETDLPKIPLPVRVFIDAGLMPNYKPSYERNGSSVLLYEAGLSFSLARDVVNLYVPIVLSSDFKDNLSNTWGGKSFGHGISFTLMFQDINWLRTPGFLLKKSGM